MNTDAKTTLSPDLAGSNGEQAALHNRGVVLRAIHRGGAISRTEIARQSGLTKQAIARIAERLIDEGLVVEARRRFGLRGQPAIELEINPSGAFSVGANIDRDHLTIVAMDATGAVRARIHHEKRFIMPEEFLALMRNALANFRNKRAIDEARFAGLGIAIPDWLGEVPVIGRPAEYRAWTDFDIVGELGELTRHPVYIANDANSAAAGELQFGLGRESRTFFYILANACLGGGLVLDGVQHRGTAGLSGEIGWLPTGTAGNGGELLGKVFSLFLLYEHLAAHGVSASEPRDLLNLDPRGRALVSQWLKDVSRHIAEAVVHVGLIVDPDAIIIGGRFPVRLLDELLLHVHERLEGMEHPPVHRAGVSEDTAALGAAAMPLAETLMLRSADAA